MMFVYVSRSLAAGKGMPFINGSLATGKRARNAKHRPGLTLFEVVLAMAIFLIGITALYQLIQTGSYRAL